MSSQEYRSRASSRAAAPSASRLGRHDVPVPGDVGRDDRRRARERAREHHPEALAAERGRDERLPREQLRREGVLVEEAEHVDSVLGHALAREQEPYGERVGADDAQPRARPLPDPGPRAQEDLEPLPRLLPPGEDDPVLAPAGVSLGWDEDAVRDDLVVAGKPAPLRL